MASVSKKKEIGFEEALKRLEEISTKMGDSAMTLDESIKLFQEGMELSAICNNKLEEAEKKISVVVGSKDGRLVEAQFNSQEE